MEACHFIRPFLLIAAICRSLWPEGPSSSFDNGGPTASHPTSYRLRGHPRLGALPRPSLVQDPVADRIRKRAHPPKAGPHVWRLHRSGAAAEPSDRTQRLRQMDREIAAALNAEGFVAARDRAFSSNVWPLRTLGHPYRLDQRDERQSRPMARRNLLCSRVGGHPGGTPPTVFDYLARGLLEGHQLTKGQPGQIELQTTRSAHCGYGSQRNRRSRKEAL